MTWSWRKSSPKRACAGLAELARAPHTGYPGPTAAAKMPPAQHRNGTKREMRLLFLGDMVGRTGRTAVWEQLPGLIRDFRLDFVIVNGENAAGGFGITEEIFHETISAGADVVTTGNHVWDQKEA